MSLRDKLEDQADRKSLAILNSKLEELIKNSQRSKTESKASPKKKKTESPSNKVRKNARTPHSHQHTKITAFFKPAASSPKKVGNVTSHLKKDKPRTPSKSSPSFDKYGYVLPSYAAILAQNKEFEDYKKKVDSLDKQIQNDILLEIPQLMDPFKNVKVLDCKKLSLGNIRRAFYMHKDTLQKIFDGNTSTITTPRQQCKKEYSPALIFFTDDQKSDMMRLLNEEFPRSLDNVEYFCRVLLPELCTLIFMDSHHMTKKDALKYMAEVPI